MDTPSQSFDAFFQRATGKHPHPWQRVLAGLEAPDNRLIRIPTGLGKTAGTVLPWLWHRVARADDRWPRRLVFCLPMRVLVEQTEASLRDWLTELALLWDSPSDHAGRIGIHVLMGGADAGEWHLHPEHPAILLGTQDMLLSRALNRGYGSPRARWPMELGLLTQDCLWIFDELQLMDAGLATSAQLQQFREQDREKGLRPSFCWWMSATLQPEWLRSVDTSGLVEAMGAPLTVPPVDRVGPLWEVEKRLEVHSTPDATSIAQLVLQRHSTLEDGPYGRITLVVMNTVDRAMEVYRAIMKERPADRGETCLVHSRFRGRERARWRAAFLNREACARGVDRIIVATQVIEAGVDISAGCLVTELAPWSSLVQRFGRAARYGGSAHLIVIDSDPKDDRAAAPYTKEELESARDLACACLPDVAQDGLEAFETSLSDEHRRALYPYAARHLLLRHEWEALFDTTADLTGADIDISRFIRSGDERDVQVFWASLEPGTQPPDDLQPGRDALCPVPFLKARDWLCGTETKERRAPRLLASKRAWVWDWLEGAWRRLERKDIYPGQILLVASACGGYDPQLGWSPGSNREVPALEAVVFTPEDRADAAQDAEALSVHPWKTIACHGGEVAILADRLGEALNLPPAIRDALRLAGRWHDLGKAHPAFQGSIRDAARPQRADLAKAPKQAWPARTRYRYPVSDEHRPGFRHELASALALFAVLLRHRPDHPALLGPWHEALMALDGPPMPRTADAPRGPGAGAPMAEGRTNSGSGASADGESGGTPGPVEQAILELDSEAFDLVAYLVASHHGKVRAGLHAAPADQAYLATDDGGLPIRGVREGDLLPETVLEVGSPALPVLSLTLEPAMVGLSPRTGSSWTERVQRLVRRYGPGTLAYLEACLRAADIRASRLDTPDPLLTSEVTT